ncbi:hypothetical protein C8Q74DRAFT_678914 [Fomes fomentarius]|nr:hypothetical protein C8Q74DRAFT_678914 [Fomes fomentarius]
MGLLQSLRQLQHLQAMCHVSNAISPEVATESEAWRIQPLLTFLSSLPPRLSAGLTKLTIRIHPLQLSDDRGRTYDVNRDCFLDSLIGGRELTDTLHALSALRLLCVEICENDLSQYDEKWWRAEIATRLQVHLRPAIDVVLHIEQEWDLLWCTHAVLLKALGLDDGQYEALSTDNEVLSDNDEDASKDIGDQTSSGAENIPLPPSRSQSPSPAPPSLPSTPSTLS